MNGINLDLFRAGQRGKPDAENHVLCHAAHARATRRTCGAGCSIGDRARHEDHLEPVRVPPGAGRVHREPRARQQRCTRGSAELPGTGGLRGHRAGRSSPPGRPRCGSARRAISGTTTGSFGRRQARVCIRHPASTGAVDMVVEQDASRRHSRAYQVLYLTDDHVSRAARRRSPCGCARRHAVRHRRRRDVRRNTTSQTRNGSGTALASNRHRVAMPR